MFQYFYTQINNNQTQSELFTICWSSLYSYTGPLRGGHDADLAHGENEFDTSALTVNRTSA